MEQNMQCAKIDMSTFECETGSRAFMQNKVSTALQYWHSRANPYKIVVYWSTKKQIIV